MKEVETLIVLDYHISAVMVGQVTNVRGGEQMHVKILVMAHQK